MMSKANVCHIKTRKKILISEAHRDWKNLKTASENRRLNRIITLYENKIKCLDYTIHNNRFLTPSLVKKAKSQLIDLLDRFSHIYEFELYLENLTL